MATISVAPPPAPPVPIEGRICYGTCFIGTGGLLAPFKNRLYRPHNLQLPNWKERKMSESEATPGLDFIRTIIDNDVKDGKNGGKVQTRFPPEPNGCLHIGHAKAFNLDFGAAEEFGGLCNLRYDDTNPSREEVAFVESIQEDIKWLGFDWGDRLFFASDYFDKLFDFAADLIKQGKAYVCDLNGAEIRQYRGSLTEPGKNSPYRDRTAEENLDLFNRMKSGEFEDGSHVLRAKIDMTSPNLNLRDPVIYRIQKAHHHRTGDTWCIYPMYDFTHCISDALEGITHSLCSLEFEDHRPLYDWFLDQLDVPCHPQQIEFARLNLTYTVMSKRKLKELVASGAVSGWDDPRLPTLSGMRRRGYTPTAIREFLGRIGMAKRASTVDMALLEFVLREELNKTAPRVMGVLKPLKVVIENYPDDLVEEMTAVNNPEAPEDGTRLLPFSKEVYIERDDFMEDPPKKFFRLAPGREVRLRYAYLITCTEVIKDESGEIVELRCTYDPETKGGNAPDGRRVKATMHWVSAAHAIETEVRLYEHLLSKPELDGAEENLADCINPNSLQVLSGCQVEPSLASAEPGTRIQFERLGYFCVDSSDSMPGKPVFNRIVTLRDAWAKIQKKRK
jgi:glutaminyl-tRNA synthetase